MTPYEIEEETDYIILDETTSEIDIESERKILNNNV